MCEFKVGQTWRNGHVVRIIKAMFEDYIVYESPRHVAMGYFVVTEQIFKSFCGELVKPKFKQIIAAYKRTGSGNDLNPVGCIRFWPKENMDNYPSSYWKRISDPFEVEAEVETE